MGQPIIGRDQYNAVFSTSDQRKAALERALDIRKFEIGLYWERAKYFWTLLIATFSGYFLLAANDKYDLLFLVSCIGLVVSIGWYLVNRGSKHWQENWERHVDALEDEEVGPLYKTTIADEEFRWWELHAGYPYSVSKINQIVSLFVVVIWFAFFIMSFLSLVVYFVLPSSLAARGPNAIAEPHLCILFMTTAFVLVITIGFVFALLRYGRSRRAGEQRNINFRRSDLD